MNLIKALTNLQQGLENGEWGLIADGYEFLSGDRINPPAAGGSPDYSTAELVQMLHERFFSGAEPRSVEDDGPDDSEPPPRPSKPTGGKKGSKKRAGRKSRQKSARDIMRESENDYKNVAHKFTPEELLKAKKEGRILTPFSDGNDNTERVHKTKNERKESLVDNKTCPNGHTYNKKSVHGFKGCPTCVKEGKATLQEV